MPSRRSHTNSHHGCLQCKAKRVKCDQAQPKCSRCDKKNSECTYRHIMTNYNPFQYQQAARAAAAAGGTGPSTSSFMTTTTTTMTQTTPPTTITAGGPSSSSSEVVHSRSSSAPATPAVAAAGVGVHAASWSGVRKTSLSIPRPQQLHQVQHYPRFRTSSVTTDRLMQAVSTQANIINQVPPPPPHHHHPHPQHTPSMIPTLGTLPPFSGPPPSYMTATTPAEVTHGYTPAAMTVVTDPVTMGPIVSAPTPTTLVATPSPPLHHVLPLRDDEQFYLDHYAANLTGPGMAPVLESELFQTINNAIIKHSTTSSHVQHVVIAFAALHLAATTQNPSGTHSHHLATALHHKAMAIKDFRPALEAGITPDNGESLLATAAVLVSCGFALPVADPSCKTRYNTIDLLSEIIGLFQGTAAILKHGIYHDSPREAHQRSTRANLPSPAGDAPWSEGERSIQTLQQVIEALQPKSERDHVRKAALLHATSKLRRSIDLVTTDRKPAPVTCLWLGMVNKDFINLVTEKDPLALALVAHWAGHRGNAGLSWWTSGWLDSFMAALQETIGDEHKYLISWCLSRANQGAIEANFSQIT